MKKLLILSIFLFLVTFTPKVEAKKSYNTFQEIEVYGGKMLKNFTDSDYQKYYKNISKRKLRGWRIHLVNDGIKAKFVSETIFSYYNNGLTPITYKYKISESKVDKCSVSSTGSIKQESSGEENKIKYKLEEQLKLDFSISSTVSKEESTTLDIVIDPKTVANLRIVGEGKIINGVAAYYFLFIKLAQGGFEYFIVTTQYPRLEVLPI